MRQIFPLSANVLDLRRDLTLPYTTVPAGTPIYTVTDVLDLGTSGPFFFDPGRAILWGFYRGINNGTLTPIDIFYKFHDIEQSDPGFKPGKILPRFEFPGNNQVLLELKSSKTILFDSIMLNPLTSIGTMTSWTEESLSPMVLAFCNDKSRSSRLAPNLAYYNLTTKLSAIFSPQQILPYRWITLDRTNSPDLDVSIANVIRYLSGPMSYMRDLALDMNRAVYTPMPPEVNVSEIGIRICKPQEMFRSRAYYPIIWEKVWISFIGYLHNSMTIVQIREAILPTVPELVGERNDIPDPFFPIPVAVEILKKFDDPKDILSLCSVDTKFKNRVCTSLAVQSLIRDKYLPSIRSEYLIPKNPTRAEVRHIIGLPRESKNKKWWNIAPVFFIEDIPLFTEEEEILTGDNLRSKLAAGVNEEEQRKKRLRPFREKRQMIELSLEEAKSERTRELLTDQLRVLKLEEDKVLAVEELAESKESRKQRPQEFKIPADQPMFRKLQLSSYAINKVIRNSNSFIAMFSLIYSMGQYSSMPSTIQISIKIPGENVVRQNYLARQTESMAGAKTPLELLTSTPRSDPEISIKETSITGSWLHQLDIAPIFLHPEFYSILQKIKATELKRFRLNEELMRANYERFTSLVPRAQLESNITHILEPVRHPLTNNLIIYRLDVVVAYIVHSSIGGTPSRHSYGEKDTSLTIDGKYTALEYVDINIAIDGIDPSTLEIIRNHLLLDPYMNPDIDINNYYKLFSVNESTRTDPTNPYSSVYLLFTSDIITVRFSLAKTKDTNKIYFQVYMYLDSFIRLMFLEENCDSAEWSVGF